MDARHNEGKKVEVKQAAKMVEIRKSGQRFKNCSKFIENRKNIFHTVTLH
jgi:hypothetical protein